MLASLFFPSQKKRLNARRQLSLINVSPLRPQQLTVPSASWQDDWTRSLARAAANSASEDRRVIYSGNDLGFRERRTGRRRRREGGKAISIHDGERKKSLLRRFPFRPFFKWYKKRKRDRERRKGRYLLSRVSTRTVKREKPRQNRDGETEEEAEKENSQDSTRGKKEGRRFCFRLSFSAVPCFSRPTTVSPFSTPRFSPFSAAGRNINLVSVRSWLAHRMQLGMRHGRTRTLT